MKLSKGCTIIRKCFTHFQDICVLLQAVTIGSDESMEIFFFPGSWVTELEKMGLRLALQIRTTLETDKCQYQSNKLYWSHLPFPKTSFWELIFMCLICSTCFKLNRTNVTESYSMYFVKKESALSTLQYFAAVYDVRNGSPGCCCLIG